MKTPMRALVLTGIGAAAFAAAAHAQTYYHYGYAQPPAMVYAPPIYYAPAPQYPARYHYVPPGLSITTPLGTYAPFYGGWQPYSHANVGGYDHYRLTPDR